MSDLRLDGSAFLPIVEVDDKQRFVTCELFDPTDQAGRVLDYATSKAAFLALKGAEVFALGKASAVAKIASADADDDKRRVFLKVEPVDSAAWPNFLHGVFAGLQCRLYETASLGKSAYSALPGAMCAVDRPFDNATILRKGAEIVRVQDQVARLNAAVAKAGAPTAGSGETLTKAVERRASIEERLAKLEAEPLPPKCATSPLAKLRVVDKGEDSAGVADAPAGPPVDAIAKWFDALPEEERGRLAMKHALTRPIAVRVRE